MSTFRTYPKIVHPDRRPEILAVREAVATEKIHGTNFRVFLPEALASIDEIRFGCRNEELDREDSTFYGGRPVRFFTERVSLLERMLAVVRRHGFGDTTVFGEMFGAGIQKHVRYATDHVVRFRAFDIMIGDNFVTYDRFVELCDEMGLDRVPEVWRGEPSLAAFDALLERDSTVARENGVAAERNMAEGVVIRSNPLLRDVFGQWLMVKHKSAGFAEVKERRSVVGAELGPAQAFAERFVLPGRIDNALGRLRDRGLALAEDMADMRILVPEILADLLEEHASEWQAAIVAGTNDKTLRGAVTRTLGSTYRRMLNARALT